MRSRIDGGFREIDLGITTLEPKLDVGAVPVQLFAWVKHHNRVVQRLMLALSRGPLRPRELAPRRVFKDPPQASSASRRATASHSATASASRA